MLRLIALLCLVHFSVSNVIRGGSLLNGDASQGDPISANSQLFLRFEQISEADKMKRLSWSELVGHEGTYALQCIKERTGFTNVVIVPEGSPVTMDFRTDRVRVFVNEKGIVIRVPRIG